MPTQRLKEFLDSNKVKYVVISHSQAFTAQEIAASAHIPGRQLAKTVMVTLDGNMAMAVLPATDHVDLRLLKKAAGVKKAKLAGEKEFKDLFPDCEIGPCPPSATCTTWRFTWPPAWPRARKSPSTPAPTPS